MCTFDRKFTYVVVQEGIYPSATQLRYTEAPNYFPVPDYYIIKTTWGRDNLQYQVVSVQSPFNASVELHEIITPNKKTAVSGIHLFGLQLKCIDRNRKGRPHELKPNEKSSKTTQIKCTKGLAKKEQVHFEDSIKDFYNPKDRVVLKALNFTVKNKEYHKLIPINFIDLNSAIIQEDPSEEPDIIDPTIIEQVVNATGKGAYRSIKKILEYIVLSYVNEGKLDPEIPVIHLRISGDGRNVGRKVKHVMITVALLDDSMNLFKSDYHYTIVLFLGTENYSTLKVATVALIQELQELSNTGMVINDIFWWFELFFSSDWKFLSICLGFNAANSNHFCPWCEITKNQHGNGKSNWMISKSMSVLSENPTAYPGHKLPPLFNMISLKNHIPDKLHIMLRITDRL
ncbi:hypothetical protein GLOIN_2v1809230 [Rhizophagus clarus]|uniref:Uncharacterized protein n=1 Tax=Rhizophagus clarus TaxID=94130 RepID=A0A8H3L416_9GLOM|nr:hypothetical protein GLOIN_2v1809230 [Rhizophagus clarus]